MAKNKENVPTETKNQTVLRIKSIKVKSKWFGGVVYWRSAGVQEEEESSSVGWSSGSGSLLEEGGVLG